ncbi:hypothetical protein RhiirB3_532766 [Rhizophagus irregularis]|nr:hypothetical protein RhiirB3_532766 [Rhizophagus irregularis]
MINGKEISWRHIKGVYDHTCLHATAKATRLTKCHIWLSSWSKIRVDFAEHTLSKEVEDALLSIKELKNISEGTRDYIKYSRKYRQIMHSKINFQSLEDPRIDTLNKYVIDGFLGIIAFILNKYPGSMIQPKRISQDMLEGLFGTIRELGGDSSTQTLKSYGYDLNKYQITTLVSTEIKSVNYGVADSTGTGITTLARRDYRKDKKKSNNEDNYNYQKHFIRLTQLSSLSHNVFKSLLIDDLIMGKIKIPLESQTILYKDSIDKLLQKWQDIIKKMARSWYQDFLDATNLNGSSTQKLVAYLLLERVIKITFGKATLLNGSQSHLSANNHLMPKEIIVLESEEASKFSYIVGWIIYKLTKNDNTTKSHSEFETICTHLMILNSEQVVYEQDVRSQTTNVIPGHEFLEFMYKMESLILLLFEKHREFSPNILQYIHNSLLCNLSLLETFNALFIISSQQISVCESINTEKQELKDDVKKFLYERIISIYMKSRQKSWQCCTWDMSRQNFNVPDIIPSTSRLRPVQKLSKFTICLIKTTPNGL